jgi:hypothetical protein
MLTPYVTLGGLDLNTIEPDTGVTWVAKPVGGWAGPSSSIAVVKKPRSHGGWAGDAFLNPRRVAISGSVVAPTEDALADAVDRLNAAASLAGSTLTVIEGALSRSCTVRRDDEVLIKQVTGTYAEWSVQLVAPDPRKFADALTASTGLPSSSGGLVLSTTPRTNLPTNPSVEVDAAGWAPTGVTLTRDSSWAASGSWSGKCTPNALVTGTYVSVGGDVGALRLGMVAGGTYTVSAVGRLAAPQTGTLDARARRVVVFYSVAATPTTYAPLTGTQIPNAAGQGQSSLTFTLPADAAQAFVRLYNGATNSADNSIWWDSVLVETGTAVGNYFDGDTLGASWSGTPHASTSTIVDGLTIPFTIDSTVVSGQVSLTNPGNVNGPVSLRIDGPVTGPVVTHVGSGRALVFSTSLTLGAGEFVTVDMERREVLAQGQSSRNGWVTGRGWSAFEPGSNTWSFSALAHDPGALLSVTASPAWE